MNIEKIGNAGIKCDNCDFVDVLKLKKNNDNCKI